MGAITIAIIALVAAVCVGFAAFIGFYHVRRQQQRGGMGAGGAGGEGLTARFVPSSIRGVFGGSKGDGDSGTRFAALDVDEAWDSHVDEEMGYDSVRMHATSHAAKADALTHDELDERYDEIMDPADAGPASAGSSNPFGSGSTRVGAGSRKSTFREDV